MLRSSFLAEIDVARVVFHQQDLHTRLLKEHRYGNLQGTSEFFDAFDGWIARTSLDVGNVGAMKTGAIRQFFLRDAQARLFAS
jgi:hypothetical protein